MKKIKLTKGKEAIVDDDFLSIHKWCAKDFKNKFYAARRGPENTTILMSREIMDAPDNMEVDHINGNTLDNRRCNLRICTRSQNQYNRDSDKNSSSKYKGVSYIKKWNKWQAEINGMYIGCFKTEEAAAREYDWYASKLHKEFARLNFT